jgi:hypothetical protein
VSEGTEDPENDPGRTIREAHRLRSRPYEGVCRETAEKGKPLARQGRKATGLWGVDRLQNRHEDEWEPGGALREALVGLPLVAGPGRGADLAGHLAGLRPLAEEALGALGLLERRRGLSDAERTRAEALRRLLAAAGEVE